MRRALLSSLGVLGLAACGQPEQAAAPAAAPVAAAPAAPAGPLTYTSSTTSANVSLTLPERVGQLPALYAKLYSEERNTLAAFTEGATEEVEDLKATGFPAMPYEKEVVYAVTAETPRLLSLSVDTYESTGGAHPNSTLGALTWDKTAGAVVETGNLFRPDADLTAADEALCAAIRAAKAARLGADGPEVSECPKLRDVNTTLVASTTPGKAGGLTARFSPYDIGVYAEGPYEIVVPAQAFASALAPAYAAEFGGVPVPEPVEAPAPAAPQGK